MQDNSFPQLRLENPDRLFGSPPQGVDGMAVRKAIEAALAEIADKNDPSNTLPDDPSGILSDGGRLRVLANAGWRLSHNPAHQQEAVHLTETAAAEFKDSPALGHIRLLALSRIGAGPELSHEIDRLITATEKNPRFQSILRDFLLARPQLWQSNSSTHHRFIWGTAATTLRAQLDTFRQTGAIVVGLHQIMTRFKTIRSEEEVADPEFTRRLAWGLLVSYYLKLIRFCAGKIHAKGPTADLTVEERQLLSLTDEMNDLITVDLSPLQKACESGRNVVILEAHAGVTMFDTLRLQTLGVPISTISAGTATIDTPMKFDIAAEGPDVQMRFLKLIKLMKAGQRIVRVFPDGGAGDLKPLDFLGIPVTVGQGAATLAWRGKADIFFPTSRWTGSEFHITFQAGPQASRYTSRSNFEEEMYEFYLAQWRNIILGPPEDMAPIGGFWRFF